MNKPFKKLKPVILSRPSLFLVICLLLSGSVNADENTSTTASPSTGSAVKSANDSLSESNFETGKVKTDIIPGLPPLRKLKKESSHFSTVKSGENSIAVKKPVLKELSNPGDLFLQAENYYHSGDLSDAQLNYNDFLKFHPNDPRIPQAIYRLGTIDFARQSYVSSLRLMDFLVFNHSSSSFAKRGLSVKGKCLFELKRFNEAEAVFDRVLKDNPDGALRWEALVFLGKINAKKADYKESLERLLEIEGKELDEDLKEEAHQQIEALIKEGLDKGQLVELSRQYLRQYPGDLALLRLMDYYRAERDSGSYQIVLEDFISRFPTHPKIEFFRRVQKRQKKDSRRVIRIGAVLPLSGERALVGQKVLQGIQLAFNQLSLVEKEKMELVVRDSGIGRDVNKMIEELAEDPNVVGIIGPILSGEVRESAKTLEQYQLAAFTPTASSPGLTELSPNIFRNALTRGIQARFLAEHAINDMGLYRFVILYPDENFGHQLRDEFTEHVKALGGTIVESLSYDRSQSDFKEQILKIGGVPDDKLKKIIMRHLKNGTRPKDLNDKGVFSRPVVEGGVFDEDEIEGLKVSMELNYDAIFIPGLYDKVGLIAPQLVFYNIEQVQLLGTNGWNSRELVDQARKYLGSALFVDGYFSNSRLPHVQKFKKEFFTTFGEEPPALSAQAYDSARIFIKLIRENAQNRIEILKRLPKIKDFPGVAGTTTILPSGESEKKLSRLRVRGHRIEEVE
ncbi:MAG: ABC transporter substrate-binding protein [Candidatus Nitronauta litoralis]|uniref:ABC transporter substrate-binding protein n=1 Tax=Candidatus Nitronauta litoralis TaxID=2705533 RepID=A0A7T0BYD0_9BACT|nr:MAG: ABC transporter substrate-binding protein [Candidatus Nitronauta litoralis]